MWCEAIFVSNYYLENCQKTEDSDMVGTCLSEKALCRWVFFKKVSSYPWSDASCSEFQNIHCHQATECFETIINPWVRMTYHSRCTSSSQSCHHLLSPWLWWNSWWRFFGWGLKVENTILQDHSRGEQRKCPGRQLGVQRVANAQGRSCDTPDMESRWSSLGICCECADKKSVLKVELCLWCSLASPEFLQSFCRTCPIDHWHSCLDYCAPVWNVGIWHGHCF